MRILSLALLSWLLTFPVAKADTPPVAISFGIDMSDSTHTESIEGRTPSELQLSALASALLEMAERNLSCASPFQIQVVYFGEQTYRALPWLTVPNTAAGFEAAAAAVQDLGPQNLFLDGHGTIPNFLTRELSASGSPFQLGVITANGTVYPGTVSDARVPAGTSRAHLYGAAIIDVATTHYMEAVTHEHTLVQSRDELRDWFVQIFRTTIAPEQCFVS